MEELKEQYNEKIKERSVVNEKLRNISHKKRSGSFRPENETLVVKIFGESAQEYPNFKTKRSRSPKRVEIQTEKPPSFESSNTERLRSKKIFGFMLNHLKQAKDDFMSKKDEVEQQHKIENKVAQEIKKVNEDLKMQTREEIAVRPRQKVRSTEMKKKKELDEEISRLETEIKVLYIQKTGQSKRIEAYRKYILSEYSLLSTLPPIFYLPSKHNDLTKKRLNQSIQKIQVNLTQTKAGVWKKVFEENIQSNPN